MTVIDLRGPIGIGRDPVYFEIAARRIAAERDMFTADAHA